jgi:ribosomal protein L7/L12
MLWALLAVIVVGGLLLLVRARRRSLGTDLVGSQLAAANKATLPTGPLEDAELRQRIAALMRNGRKIQAIKLLREHRPMSLADAKAAVEREDLTWPPGHRPEATLDAALLAEARRLAREGRNIQAIKLVRQRTGLGLVEAKQLVDRL